MACFFAIEEKIAQSAAFYQREFGVVPQFSAALHAGAVVVSECGNSKRQIAYFGDTVNVAARLQEEGKARAASLVASASVLKGVTLSPEFEAQSYGDVRLRGREAPDRAVPRVSPRNREGCTSNVVVLDGFFSYREKRLSISLGRPLPSTAVPAEGSDSPSAMTLW